MSSLCKRKGLTILGGLIALTWGAPLALAQNPPFQVGPGMNAQQAAFNAGTVGRANAIAAQLALTNGMARGAGAQVAPFNPYAAGAGMGSLVTNPYAAGTLSNNPYLSNPGFGGYYPPYSFQDPYNGYLTGGASVISAQSQFMVSQQQALLLHQQVKQARIDVKRKAFDEFLYEREKMPTVEEERERTRIMERDRSRNDPPVTEIFSAKALNDLLVDLQKLQARGQMATFRGQVSPVDEDDLRRVNVTTKSGGNIGLLKNDGRLNWPIALSGETFKEERERLNSLAQEAVKQASFNTPVDAGTLQQLDMDVEKISRQLRKSVNDLPTGQYIEAKKFLSNFEDAIKALRAPDAGNYFTKRIKAKTIAELVDFMTQKGLQFAPAVAGDEAAYLALHRALAAYDTAVMGQGGEAPK